ncbi:molybdopterin molybdotransferase MoeA [Clostridium psychrophilum]|uniref:molybdopterin molybdotransferase MoeA n=1 Tax=Clostridium psychrophilum TaxID=132926 RepID=UPI001C0C7AC6|nr:molybdopterin molybdotransferase MoeA [Clostridium psychrophilum]MBU3181118.1 molybdopterin molybdotransferase MoeA [Clostridium psychrophilum]
MELFNVVSVEEAKQIIDKSFNYKLRYEKINILKSVSRISFKDIKADCNIPEFKRSTVDGFAVISRDVSGASEAMPSIIELKGEVLMGKVPPADIECGECLYVPTGGMLPKSADSVVMVEYSNNLDKNTVLIYSPVAKGDNVIQVGEDIKAQDTVIKGGDKLRPYEIGVLASIGVSDLMVYKRPKVGIISTGDEVVTCNEKPSLGEVRDINTYLIWSLVVEDGFEPVSYGIIKDDYELLKSVTNKAFNECDLVLISGGSSVGTKDHTLKVIASFDDGEVLIHGIAVKPGKPTIIGKHNGKIIFGLPGHPLACSVIYKILVRNYIYSLMSQNEKNYGINAVMSINYHKAKGREEYLPVELETIDGLVVAKPVFGKSGIITAFSKAFGYIIIEKNVEGLKENQTVEVYKL